MDMFSVLATSTFGAAVVTFFLVVGVLWLILPFSIFGIKTIMRDMQTTQMQILDQLRSLNSANSNTVKDKNTKKCPDCGSMVYPTASHCRFCDHVF